MRLVLVLFTLSLAACGENYDQPIQSNLDAPASSGGEAQIDDPTSGVATADDTTRD